MITEIQRVSGKVVFQITNTKGKVISYRVFPEVGLGDAKNGKEFATLHEAKASIEIRKKIDRVNGFDIFKITNANNYPGEGCCYEYVIPDTQDVQRVASLSIARNALGGIVNTNPTTKPKSEYAHNQSGYRADSRRAVKA